MIPKHHIIAGAIISIIIFLIFQLTPAQTLIIFLSSFLIDIDHYIYYAVKKKDFNPIKATKWFFKKRKIWIKLTPKERKKYKRVIIIFHGIEFWILLIIFSLFNRIFLFIFIGVAIHMLLDFIELIHLNEPFYSKLSVIQVIRTNKNKEILSSN